MQLLVFTVVAAVAFMVAYAFGVGGTDSSLIFLAILFTGVGGALGAAVQSSACSR